jgi:hypothetical protein
MYKRSTLKIRTIQLLAFGSVLVLCVLLVFGYLTFKISTYDRAGEQFGVTNATYCKEHLKLGFNQTYAQYTTQLKQEIDDTTWGVYSYQESLSFKGYIDNFEYNYIADQAYFEVTCGSDVNTLNWQIQTRESIEVSVDQVPFITKELKNEVSVAYQDQLIQDRYYMQTSKGTVLKIQLINIKFLTEYYQPFVYLINS